MLHEVDAKSNFAVLFEDLWSTIVQKIAILDLTPDASTWAKGILASSETMRIDTCIINRTICRNILSAPIIPD
jgi:hypothetical protein